VKKYRGRERQRDWETMYKTAQKKSFTLVSSSCRRHFSKLYEMSTVDDDGSYKLVERERVNGGLDEE